MTKLNREQWIEKCNNIHNNFYTYDKWPLTVGSTDKVEIYCPNHGYFTQIVDNHARGKGCPTCGNLSRSKNRSYGRDYFIENCRRVHNNYYDYSSWPDTVYNSSKVPIYCPKHGYFFQKVDLHQRGSICPRCAVDKRAETIQHQYGVTSPRQLQLDEQSRAVLHNKQHLERLYHQLGSTIKVAETLNVGAQTVANYLHYHNIEIIQNNYYSCGEREIAQLCEHFSGCICNDKSLIPPHEVDIYVPRKKLAIEYCGLYWHSEQAGKGKWYHYNKWTRLNEQGIRLLTIFEDEWLLKKQMVTQKILNQLHCEDKQQIYARNTSVKPISRAQRDNFLQNYHIQGTGRGSINLGLFYNQTLLGVCTFIHKQHRVYELNRYATSCNIPGGFSKVVKYFTRNFKWKQVVTFADLRWSNGHLYTKTGWIYDKFLPPDYYYSPPGGVYRMHKSLMRHKHLRSRLKQYDPSLSEKQNCDLNGFLRIWDCGKRRFSIYNDIN